jgi:hypothetical protein
MNGSCRLHLDTRANILSNYFQIFEGRRIESRQAASDKPASLAPARSGPSTVIPTDLLPVANAVRAKRWSCEKAISGRR